MTFLAAIFASLNLVARSLSANSPIARAAPTLLQAKLQLGLLIVLGDMLKESAVEEIILKRHVLAYAPVSYGYVASFS